MFRIGARSAPLPSPFLFLPFFLPHHRTMQSRSASLWAALLFVSVVSAHGGHEAVPEGSTTSEDPIVRGVCSLLGGRR
jgi:hypothetical protein